MNNGYSYRVQVAKADQGYNRCGTVIGGGGAILAFGLISAGFYQAFAFALIVLTCMIAANIISYHFAWLRKVLILLCVIAALVLAVVTTKYFFSEQAYLARVGFFSLLAGLYFIANIICHVRHFKLQAAKQATK